MSASCAPVPPCCKKSDAATECGEAPKKDYCKFDRCPPCCRKKPHPKLEQNDTRAPKAASSCCSKNPKFPMQDSTSPLSPNHYQVPSKKGISSCCAKPKEQVEYLSYSGDKLDDVFKNPAKKGSSCCSSGRQTPQKRRSCCSSGRQTPQKRSSCCSSPGSPSNGQPPSKRGSSCCSSNRGPNSTDSLTTSREGACQKPCCKRSTILSKPPSHGQPPSFQTKRNESSGYASQGTSPKPYGSLTSSLNEGQSPSSQTKRKCSVTFSQGASSKPNESVTNSPKSPASGQSPSRRGSLCCSSNRSPEFQGVPTSREGNCSKPCCNSPIAPPSQTPKHFHPYRPITWPAEIPTASTWTKSGWPGISPRGSPRDGQPPSRSASPSYGSLAQSQIDSHPCPLTYLPSLEKRKSIQELGPSKSAKASTTVASQTPTLALDLEERKLILKFSPRSAEALTTVGSPTLKLAPDPEKRKSIRKPSLSKSAEVLTSVASPTPTLAPDPKKQKSMLKLCPRKSAGPSTTVASPTATLATDPEKCKSILNFCSSKSAGTLNTVGSPTPTMAPDPEKRKSILKFSPCKRADASTLVASPTSILAQDPHKSQAIQICSPLINLSHASCSTLSQSSSSEGKSPSRSTSSCFFFGRSPKRSRPSLATSETTSVLLPGPEKSKSVSNGSTSTPSESPRLCPNHGRVPAGSRSDTMPSTVELPTMSPYYGRLPSRSQTDPILSPYYNHSASSSYSPARTRSRTGLLEIPDLVVSSPSEHTTILPQQSELPSRSATSWFIKPCHADTTNTSKLEAQHPGPGRARRFWTRLWNRSTSLSYGGCLHNLASLLTPIPSASKSPANPPYVKDDRWIECSDTRAFFIFGVNVVIVIVLTYFVDLLHEGRQNSEAVKAADYSHNLKYCHPCVHQHPSAQYCGYPVYNVDIIK